MFCGSPCYVVYYFENYFGSFVVLGIASFKLDLTKVLCSVNQILILTMNRKFKFGYEWPALLCSSFSPVLCIVQQYIFVRCD